ncbi:MAG: hypothetical protein GY853_01360 [PVC group bacterium]|nr:hypothetical protein [PVC group bacterium]
MKTTDYEILRDKLDTKKQQKARIEGAIEQIQEQLNNEYGLDTEEKVEKFLSLHDSRIANGENKLEDLNKRLDSIVDWEAL